MISKDKKREYDKAYREANKEELEAYRKANRDKIRARAKAYHQANKDKINTKRKTCYEANKEQIKAYHEANKDKILTRQRAYYKANKSKILARQSVYEKERRRADPKFRLNSSMSAGIRRSLSSNKNGAHWETIVGYTLEKLKKHLEKQFVNGMSWDNYGEWHIDHKVPISVFNFTKSEHRDCKRCWALKNLQPIWATENIAKGAKLDKHFQPSLLL